MITVTDYWAPWCGPCKTMLPIIESLISEYNVPGSEIEIKKINVDDEPEAVSKFNIASIPTLVFERDGVEIDRKVGIVQHSKLKQMIENLKS